MFSLLAFRTHITCMCTYTYACIHMYHVYAEGLGFADQGSGPDVHMHVCTHVHVCVCMYIGVFM